MRRTKTPTIQIEDIDRKREELITFALSYVYVTAFKNTVLSKDAIDNCVKYSEFLRTKKNDEAVSLSDADVFRKQDGEFDDSFDDEYYLSHQSRYNAETLANFYGVQINTTLRERMILAAIFSSIVFDHFTAGKCSQFVTVGPDTDEDAMYMLENRKKTVFMLPGSFINQVKDKDVGCGFRLQGQFRPSIELLHSIEKKKEELEQVIGYAFKDLVLMAAKRYVEMGYIKAREYDDLENRLSHCNSLSNVWSALGGELARTLNNFLRSKLTGVEKRTTADFANKINGSPRKYHLTRLLVACLRLCEGDLLPLVSPDVFRFRDPKKFASIDLDVDDGGVLKSMKLESSMASIVDVLQTIMRPVRRRSITGLFSPDEHEQQRLNDSESPENSELSNMHRKGPKE